MKVEDKRKTRPKNTLSFHEVGVLFYISQRLDDNGNFQQRDSVTATETNSTRATVNRIIRTLHKNGHLIRVRETRQDKKGYWIPAIYKPCSPMSTVYPRRCAAASDSEVLKNQQLDTQKRCSSELSNRSVHTVVIKETTGKVHNDDHSDGYGSNDICSPMSTAQCSSLSTASKPSKSPTPCSVNSCEEFVDPCSPDEVAARRCWQHLYAEVGVQ